MNTSTKAGAICVTACFLAACAGPRTVTESYEPPTEGPRATLTYRLVPFVGSETHERVGIGRDDCATLKQLKTEKNPVYRTGGLFRDNRDVRLASRPVEERTVVVPAGMPISLHYNFSGFEKNKYVNGALQNVITRCDVTVDVQLEDGKAYSLVGGTSGLPKGPDIFCRIGVIETETQLPVLVKNRCPDN